MGKVPDPDRRSQAVELVERELASVARDLAGHCLAADLAVARGDFDVVCSASEATRELAARWATLYRRLLAIRVTPSRPI